MRKISLLLIALFLPVVTFAQLPPFESFCEQVSLSRVSLSYTYTVSGRVPLSGSGKAVLQGDCFSVNGDGMEVRCNGKTRWTVDSASQEVYVESASDDAGVNPALLIGRLEEFFTVKSDTPLVLIPKKDTGGITSLTLDLRNGSLLRMTMNAKDGSTTTVRFVSMDFLPPSDDMSGFEFGNEAFPDSYVITDLR